MNSENWQAVSAALDRLLELPGDEQARFLQELRRADPDLCREVESLAEQRPSDFLEAPPEHLLAELTRTCNGALAIHTTAEHDQEGWSPAAPRRAGRYIIQEEIARGGMGAILRAFDPDIQRTLAVKILLARARAMPDAERRFLREAQITGRLQHPGIPPIHELGHLDDGTPFFAMKLIEGQTLTTLIAGSALAKGEPRFLGIFEQICRTLAYAHSQGIIHRDLKPSNVMVGAFGEVQVMDWGLAKSQAAGVRRNGAAGPDGAAPIAGEECLSHAGDIVGTPAYIAPEQARGETDRLDERCDVFGLGGMLCAMLTGRPPFTGLPADMIRKSAQGDLTETYCALAECGGDSALIEIATKCLAANPEKRYRHAGEVADAVTRWREGAQEKLKQAELAREKALVQAEEERRRRRLTLTLAALLVILVVGIAAAGFAYQQFAAQRQARAQNLNSLVTKSLDNADAERQELMDRLTDPKKVRPLLKDLPAWQASLSRARAFWQQAQKLADSESALLNPDLQQRRQALEMRLDEDEKDWQFAAKLESLQMESVTPLGGKYQWFRAAPKYATLFAERGWDIAKGDVSDIGDRVAQSPIRFALVDGLDDWATLMNRDFAFRLMQITKRADPDPWRDQIRQTPEEHDLKYYQKLTAEADFAAQPPRLLRILAMRVFTRGGDAAQIARTALIHHPGDFWLHHWAAAFVQDPDERVGYYRAAVAIRPDSGIANSTLGWALAITGDVAGGVEHCRRGVQLSPLEADSHRLLAFALFMSNDLAGSIHHYREAIRFNPTVAEDHYSLGLALKKNGDLAAAESAFQKSREMGKNSYSKAPKVIHDLQPLAAFRDGIEGKLTKNLTLDSTQAYCSVHAVRFDAGMSYQIDLTASFDTLLRVEDAERRSIVVNDDIVPDVDKNSRVIFSPAATGVYHLVATSYLSRVTGPYRLKIREVIQTDQTKTISGKLTETKERYQGAFMARHSVHMVAGRPYVIELESDGFESRLLMDRAFSDGVAPGNLIHSRIDFTPSKTGDYVIGVSSRRPGQTGAYKVTVKGYGPANQR